MGIAVKIKWLRVLEDYKHAHKQLAYTEEICQVAAPAFQEHYEDFCQRYNINLNQINHDNRNKIQEMYGVPVTPALPEGPVELPAPGALTVFEGVAATAAPPTDWSKEEKEIHDIFANVCKKIALVIHPDKLAADISDSERMRLTDMFHTLSLALEERRYFIIIEIAEQLDIELPKNYQQQVRWLKKEIKTVIGKTDAHQRTYNYRFSESETDDERDTLIKQFIHQLFGIIIP